MVFFCDFCKISKNNVFTEYLQGIASDYFIAQKNTSSNKVFFSKCDQIHGFVRIRSHLLKKSLVENFIFYAVFTTQLTLYYKYPLNL